MGCSHKTHTSQWYWEWPWLWRSVGQDQHPEPNAEAGRQPAKGKKLYKNGCDASGGVILSCNTAEPGRSHCRSVAVPEGTMEHSMQPAALSLAAECELVRLQLCPSPSRLLAKAGYLSRNNTASTWHGLHCSEAWHVKEGNVLTSRSVALKQETDHWVNPMLSSLLNSTCSQKCCCRSDGNPHPAVTYSTRSIRQTLPLCLPHCHRSLVSPWMLSSQVELTTVLLLTCTTNLFPIFILIFFPRYIYFCLL